MTRRDEILKLIIELFIKTGSPVGSKTLVEEYGLNLSSATIRNEMSQLEKDGYLEKTHTSSGRVPSEKGYRYYTENLKSASVEEEVKNAVSTILREKTKSVEEVVRQSCEMLSDLTSLASAVLGPKAEQERLVSVTSVPIAENTLVCVFVTDRGYVENKTFVLPKETTPEQVSQAIGMISKRLSGTPVGELPGKMEAMRPVLTESMVGSNAIYEAMLETFYRFAKDRMALYGKDALLAQPEFANDAGKLRKLIEFIENPDAVRETVDGGSSQDGISVSSASGADDPDLTIVSAKLNLPGENDASLSVLGPRRMDYARVSAILKYMASAIDEYFKGGKE